MGKGRNETQISQTCAGHWGSLVTCALKCLALLSALKMEGNLFSGSSTVIVGWEFDWGFCDGIKDCWLLILDSWTSKIVNRQSRTMMIAISFPTKTWRSPNIGSSTFAMKCQWAWSLRSRAKRSRSLAFHCKRRRTDIWAPPRFRWKADSDHHRPWLTIDDFRSSRIQNQQSAILYSIAKTPIELSAHYNRRGTRKKIPLHFKSTQQSKAL